MKATPDRQHARRIVSLVPSLTEALFTLGLGERVVGVTQWCVHPADRVAALTKVGGTKTPSVSEIRALQPDLVIANQEENPKRAIEALREAGIDVWVTYPRTLAEGAALLAELAGLGADAAAREAVVRPVEVAVSQAATRTAQQDTALPAPARPRVFCPIWKNPWMAVGGDTYASDLIETCGGQNVFADRGDRRYPIVELAEIIEAAPEVILLPDEPYAFGARDVAELAEIAVPAARDHRIHPIDGTLISWYGPRIARAIETVSELLRD